MVLWSKGKLVLLSRASNAITDNELCPKCDVEE